MEKTYQQLAEIFEVDEVTNNQKLEDFECWDSLTVLSIIAMASEEYNVVLKSEEIRELKTIGNLIERIVNK